MTDAMTAAGAETSTDAERTLTITRRLAAPRDVVFRAWTDPAELVRWWGPDGFTIPRCEMEVRPGGAWRTCMVSPQGREHIVSGVYREIVAPERLVFTWGWETDGVRGHETVVTLEFRDRDGQTEFVLTQGVFETVDGRDSHGSGWSSAFDCLERHLAAA